MNSVAIKFCLIAGISVALTGSLASTTSITMQDSLKASMERGKKVYENNCLACHQADGSGVSGMNPTLKKTKWVLGDKKTLINIILKGMDEEIVVNDVIFSNVMPPSAHLSDQEIADVLTYTRNSFGNKASQITEADVKKVRGK